MKIQEFLPRQCQLFVSTVTIALSSLTLGMVTPTIAPVMAQSSFSAPLVTNPTDPTNLSVGIDVATIAPVMAQNSFSSTLVTNPIHLGVGVNIPTVVPIVEMVVPTVAPTIAEQSSPQPLVTNSLGLGVGIPVPIIASSAETITPTIASTIIPITAPVVTERSSAQTLVPHAMSLSMEVKAATVVPRIAQRPLVRTFVINPTLGTLRPQSFVIRTIPTAPTMPQTPLKNYIWPTKGVITSGFGPRWGRMHRGIDIAAPMGTPIVAAAGGIVTLAGWNDGGYGNLVEITHWDGSITLYGHNSRVLVKKGQEVEQGQMIATMGSTGRSTGPHVHFELIPTGKGAVNPIAYLPQYNALN